MENLPTYAPMLSLKEIVMRRVVVIMWNHSEVLAKIVKFVISSTGHINYADEYVWRVTVENKVIDNLSKLGLLPALLSEQMLLVVNPVGLQCRNWVKFHEPYLNYPVAVHILPKLYWTTAGMIDYQKTAEEFVRCKLLNAVQRYKLACFYCIDDCIPTLWEELPDKIKSSFYNEGPLQIAQMNLEFCWPHIIKEEHNVLNDICARFYVGRPTTFQRHAFVSAAQKGNKAAAEYFSQTLTREELENSIYSAAIGIISRFKPVPTPSDFPFEKVAETFSYLLSLMNHEQKKKIFQESPFSVLLCFLQWPWQDLLFEIADRIWNFLSTEDYVTLLRIMTTKFTISDYYFPKLFQEFFMHSPVNFRKKFVDEECRSSFFIRKFCHSVILQTNCSETVKVIFRNVDQADRLRLVSSEHIFKLFCDYLSTGKDYVVEVCLREATLSEEDKETVKKAFIEFLARFYEHAEFIQDEFFQLLENTLNKISSKVESPDKTKMIFS